MRRFALVSLLFLVACGSPSLTGGTTGETSQATLGSHASRPSTETVVVHYPAGWGHRITLRGDGPLSWDSGSDTTWTAGDAWTATFDASGPFELKPLVDDGSWAIGPNWTVSPGQTLDVWPHFFHDGGTIQVVSGWHSNVLNDDRGIWIYLPPSYDENPDERYPVVYMHDGQNLFYDEDSFSGVSWNVGGAMDDGARQGTIHEAIVVGIENDANRMWEYTPTEGGGYGGGGADRYLRFITDELKPEIDRQLRTYADADHTMMIGSSLGGLFAIYAAVRRPDVFGAVGALSPSTWWDNDYIIGQVKTTNSLPARIYVDSGDAGQDNDDVTNTAELAKAIEQHGVDTDYQVAHGAEHGEYWWRQRTPNALGFLLGGR